MNITVGLFSFLCALNSVSNILSFLLFLRPCLPSNSALVGQGDTVSYHRLSIEPGYPFLPRFLSLGFLVDPGGYPRGLLVCLAVHYTIYIYWKPPSPHSLGTGFDPVQAAFDLSKPRRRVLHNTTLLRTQRSTIRVASTWVLYLLGHIYRRSKGTFPTKGQPNFLTLLSCPGLPSFPRYSSLLLHPPPLTRVDLSSCF